MSNQGVGEFVRERSGSVGVMRKPTYERLQERMAARFWRFLERARPRCEDPRWRAYRETLYLETMEAYLRLRDVEVQGMRYWATTIASVAVYPRFEGKGHFSMFVDVVRTLNPGEALCLECVLNPQLRAWCRGYGWIEEPKEHVRSLTNPSFYWVKPGAQGIGSVEAWHAGQEANGKRGLNWDTWTLRALRPYEEWRARRLNPPVLQVEAGRVRGEG